jgi:hypothetical protein
MLAFMLMTACDNQGPTSPLETVVARPVMLDDHSTSSPQRDVTTQAIAPLPKFDPGNFVALIDHPYFPLRPGTRYLYHGFDGDAPLRNVIDVTNQEKTILGVKVVVVLDRVFVDGVLTERTLDYFAQDKEGNVWYLGEDTKEYENGKVVSTAGSFLAGKEGAKAGIILRAHPKVGETTEQEIAPGVAEDRATVVSLDAGVHTPYGNFDHCIKTRDFTPLEPGAVEVKFYCKGVGFTRGRDVTGGNVRLALTRIE